MKIHLPILPTKRQAIVAATLAEVTVGVAVLAVMMVSLYGGMAGGFAVTKLSRENLRGTQIMLERMEGIRLFNWNQLNFSNSLLATTFTNSYYPLASNGQSRGITYTGKLVVTNVSFSPAPSYADLMRQVIVTINWTNSGVKRTRTMSTFVSKNGIQNYVYSN